MKGSDQAKISADISATADEVLQYQAKQYVSSMEATWRILDYPIMGNKPAIMRLPIHLENQQQITCNSHNRTNVEEALQWYHETPLTQYFIANQHYPEAHNIFYKNFPEKFAWKNKSWHLRIHSTNPPYTIGCLYSIHPSKEELFCLRLLLLHSKGHQTWNDIHTINEIQYPTYKAACIALNLIENDTIWIECMDEAICIHIPSICRNLFIFILNESLPSDPKGLFDRYQQFLSSDFLHYHSNQTHGSLEPSIKQKFIETKVAYLWFCWWSGLFFGFIVLAHCFWTTNCV